MPRYKKKYICVVGASAGGLDAISKLLAQLPEVNAPLAVVVAQHLSPTHKSRLVDLLKKTTTWPVEEARHNASIDYGKVIITPPDKDISIESDKIVLNAPSSTIGPKPSVNVLFTSASECCHDQVIGVILSGSGSDGAAGVENIKMNGGLTLVQDPKEAAYDGMPNTAIDSGMIDQVFRMEEFGTIIRDILKGTFEKNRDTDTSNLTDFEQLLSLLAVRSKVDFSGYKEATLRRRLESRMNQLKVSTLKTYLKKVREKPSELEQLFNHVLIGVTQFFRDPHAFEALREHLMNLIEVKNDKTLRIWVAGCATGEEPVSIAILLHEILGSHFSENNIQIFATDIDEEAIKKARRGIFNKESVELLPEHYVERYFQLRGDGYELKKVLRSIILFSRHDVSRNPPFLKLDLVVCRNMLIYFKNELQNQVLQTFHYALNPEGLLFIGKSEALGPKEVFFQVLDKKNKLFRSKGGIRSRGVHLKLSHPNLSSPTEKRSRLSVRTTLDKVKDSFAEVYHQPYLIIDEDQEVLYMSADVGKYLHFPKGASSNNLFKLLRTDFEILVRSAVTRAIKNDQEVLTEVKKQQVDDHQFLMRVVVRPVMGTSQSAYFVIFEEMPIAEELVLIKSPSPEFEKSARVKELEFELDQTKEHLQTYIEELETSNEEMQSLNEELQSSNEELQSSNEELETTNEELQSTNEEIQIAYSELKELNEELKEKDVLLQKLYNNVHIMIRNELQGFLLIDNEYHILEFNKRAFEIIESLEGLKMIKGRHMIEFLPERMRSLFFQFARFSDSNFPVTTKIALGEDDMPEKRKHLKLNFTQVLNDEGKRITTVGLLDVTKEEEAEKALKELNIKLRLTNNDLGRFVTLASHDLQEPMRIINRFAQILLEGTKEKLNEKQASYLKHIADNSKALSQKVFSLLTYSELDISKYNKEKISLSHIIELAKANIKNQIKSKNAQITLMSELPTVYVAKDLFVQLFQELLSNAIAFCEHKTPKIIISALEEKGHFLIKVNDNGIGILPEENEKVFELFEHSERASNITKGDGIGLSKARKIVELHGGQIKVESDGKNGSEFKIWLPT